MTTLLLTRSTHIPCAAHPGMVHTDGWCRCYVGGPAPEWPTDLAHYAFTSGRAS